MNLSTHCSAGREEKEDLRDEDAALIRMRIRDVLQDQICDENYPLAMVMGVNRKPEERPAWQDPISMDHTAGLQIAAVRDDGKDIFGAAVVYMLGPALAYIHGLAVLDSHKGRGCGTRFVGAVLSVLRKIGIQAVALEALAGDDDSVVGFWRRCGFEACTDERFDADAARTDTDRARRVCGRTLRVMEGTFNFAGTLAMFRGTAEGWSLADVHVHLPDEGALRTLAARCQLQRLELDDSDDEWDSEDEEEEDEDEDEDGDVADGNEVGVGGENEDAEAEQGHDTDDAAQLMDLQHITCEEMNSMNEEQMECSSESGLEDDEGWRHPAHLPAGH
jgi:GNAT superfamily N-acetyltransferase